jgi:hypothetical protein
MAVASAVYECELVNSVAAQMPVLAGHGVQRQRAEGPQVDGAGLHAEGTAHGWHWSSIAALAAVLLLAVGLGTHQLDLLRQVCTSDGTSDIAITHVPTSVADALAESDDWGHGPLASDGQAPVFQHFVAEHWLAMRREALTGETLEGSDLLSGGDEVRETLPSISVSDSESEEGDDWMLEAAREFYIEGVAS